MKNSTISYPYDDKHFTIGSGVQIQVNETEKANAIVYDRKSEYIIISSFGYNLSGKTYKLYYIDKKRRNAIYVYEAISESELLYEGLHAVKMRLLGEPVKLQRRNSFRVEYSAKARFVVRHKIENAVEKSAQKNDSGDEPKYRWEKREGMIVDISAGGMKMKLDKAIEPGTLLQGLFEAEGETFRFSGTVVRNESVGKSHYIGLRYVKMAKALQQKIVSLVFEIERKRLKVEKR